MSGVRGDLAIALQSTVPEARRGDRGGIGDERRAVIGDGRRLHEGARAARVRGVESELGGGVCVLGDISEAFVCAADRSVLVDGAGDELGRAVDIFFDRRRGLATVL